MKSKKKVYVGLSVDIIHEGHINILKIANSYGYVVLGILTNKAISEYKDTPVTTFRHRKLVFESTSRPEAIIAFFIALGWFMSIPVSTMQTLTPSPIVPELWSSLMPESSKAHSESRTLPSTEYIEGYTSITETTMAENPTAPHGQRKFIIGPIGHLSFLASS